MGKTIRSYRWNIPVFTIILLSSLIDGVKSQNETISNCLTCVKIGETHCFNRSEILRLDADFRSKVVIHKIGLLRSQNTLYFVYEPKISDPEYSKIGFVNLETPQNKGTLTPPKNYTFNFRTFDIDQNSETLYLGGSNGIYVLDTKSRNFTPFVSQRDTIIDICYSKDLYFLREDENIILKKDATGIVRYLQYGVIKNFVITEKEAVVMLTTTGLFVYKAGQIKTLSNNSYFRGITMDLDNNVFVWWIDGLYEAIIEDEIHKSRLMKVLDVNGVSAFAFDNENNILFTSDEYLNKYSRTGLTECNTS